MNTTYKVRSIGGSLMVVIPRHILRLVPLDSGSEVSFTVASTGTKEGPLIVVRPERVHKPGPNRNKGKE